MAVRFDADGENYTSTSSPPSGSYTVVCWFQVSTDRNTFSTVWSSDSSSSNYHYIQTDSDGTSVKAFHSDGSVITGPNVTVGTWYRLAFVVNGTAATMYWGTATGALSSASDATWPAFSPTPTTFRIGASVFTGEWLNGRVAALKHWSAALSQAEVEKEFSQYLPDRTSGLVRFHPFVANETADYSGNARTLSGGTGSTREDGPPIPWRARAPQLVLPAASAGSSVTLDGVAPSASSATGDTAVFRAVGGSASAAAGLTGDEAVSRAVAGSGATAASVTGEVTAARPLTGTASAASALVGDAQRTAGLAGTGSAAAEASGGMAAQRSLDASVTASAGLTADASVTRALGGGAASASGATGDLAIAGQVSLDGAASAAGSATAALSSTRQVAATSAATGGASGDLAANRTVAGATAAAGLATGDSQVTRGLVGTVIATGEAIGVVTVARPVTATVAASSSASATLTVNAAGAAVDDVFTAGGLGSQWHAFGLSTPWTPGRLHGRWAAGELD
ncbi:LamG-like jellyroll fold domain-containing protein [Saccharothrix variisporea]|uniref:Concanavalin A-like lectin/glucanase superfamily protein n=1 Tax=Saccharothrix variisporea TaxID=543527 RepID=A0A495X0L9_9PSEU|nr:LamG-like jellyroll fold domain-containing protein [Saccharothrix variisporea]RKT67096.1 concanavalin A-like lectin/glucanase superfamily protein [Saccharothrix variisporea]